MPKIYLSARFPLLFFMWQRYYDVHQIQFDEHMNYLKNHGKWAIFFGPDSATPGMVAYQVYYRTEALAIRGAERLYRREHGTFEGIVLGDQVPHANDLVSA